MYNRAQELHCRRGEVITRGPDWVWSLDAHCKFEQFGIQIYAAIDAFSRHIIWTSVGVSARTMISVFKQFVTAVGYRGVTPQLVRADRTKGLKTILTADAQYHLARLSCARKGDHNCTFKRTFVFSTSTKNQRIEAWWHRGSKCQSHSSQAGWLVFPPNPTYICRANVQNLVINR